MWSSGKTPASKVRTSTIKAGARERSGVRVPPSALLYPEINYKKYTLPSDVTVLRKIYQEL